MLGFDSGNSKPSRKEKRFALSNLPEISLKHFFVQIFAPLAFKIVSDRVVKM